MRTEDLVGFAIPLTYLVMLGVEALAPARRFPERRYWRAVGGLFVVILLGINAALPALVPAAWLEAHRVLDLSRLPLAIAILLGYLVVSFVNYAIHRAQHRFDAFFRVHQVHHAPQRMDLSGAAYTSPLEVLIMAAVSLVVTVPLLGLDPLAAAGVGYVGALYSMFQHWNVRTPSWLGYVIQRPESHCVHHARGLHAYNYSDLPLWDLLFGTFRNPATFDGEVGFDAPDDRRFWAMLFGGKVGASTEPEASS